MASYDKLTPPTKGAKIIANPDGSVTVPDEPVIPYIEGDGIGVDITPAMPIRLTGYPNRATEATNEAAPLSARALALVGLSTAAAVRGHADGPARHGAGDAGGVAGIARHHPANRALGTVEAKALNGT